MGKLRLTRPNPGGIQLDQWLNQGSGDQVVDELDSLIRPSQLMHKFQERRFWLTNPQTLAQGEFVTWTLTVPEKESWEIDHVTLLQTDDIPHDVQLVWGPPEGSPSPRMVFSRKSILQNQQSNLFPTRNLESDILVAEQFEFTGRIKLGQNERLQIQDASAINAAGGAVVTMAVKAHQIPIYVLQESRNELQTAVIL